MSEKFTLLPEEVALLDPFGVREISASKTLEKLLKNQPEEHSPEVEKIIALEKEAWQKVLGREFEIKPLPQFVTPEVRRNLEKFGFALRFIPSLDLDLESLKENNIDEYLQKLKKSYPNWRPYESLTVNQEENHRVVRNLRRWYWERVETREVSLPNLFGFWLAVETIKKPGQWNEYHRSLVTDRLGSNGDRFNISWNDLQEMINKVKYNLLLDLGLPTQVDLRLLDVLEWNLLANREGWGKTDTFEWTNTKFRDDESHLIIGDSDSGGAAYVDNSSSDDDSDCVGFRVAIVLNS